MTVRRGRILKAADIELAAQPVEWSVAAAQPAVRKAHVEVLRENGRLQIVRIHCDCGRTHQLELAPDGPESRAEKPAGLSSNPEKEKLP